MRVFIHEGLEPRGPSPPPVPELHLRLSLTEGTVLLSPVIIGTCVRVTFLVTKQRPLALRPPTPLFPAKLLKRHVDTHQTHFASLNPPQSDLWPPLYQSVSVKSPVARLAVMWSLLCPHFTGPPPPRSNMPGTPPRLRAFAHSTPSACLVLSTAFHAACPLASFSSVLGYRLHEGFSGLSSLPFLPLLSPSVSPANSLECLLPRV